MSNKLRNRLLGNPSSLDSVDEEEFVTPPDSPVNEPISKQQKLQSLSGTVTAFNLP